MIRLYHYLTAGKARAAVRSVLRRASAQEDAFVILSGGTIFLRKGVDLFLACAAAVARLAPKRPVAFVWISARVPLEHDGDYWLYLEEQIARSGLHDTSSSSARCAIWSPRFGTQPRTFRA